jgi:hypothetical protein
VGLAGNVGRASAGQRAYLGAGGIGFIIGDRRLNGAAEYSSGAPRPDRCGQNCPERLFRAAQLSGL